MAKKEQVEETVPKTELLEEKIRNLERMAQKPKNAEELFQERVKKYEATQAERDEQKVQIREAVQQIQQDNLFLTYDQAVLIEALGRRAAISEATGTVAGIQYAKELRILS